MIAIVKKSNNLALPPGTEIPVEKLFAKFESKSFGRYFLVEIDGQVHKCNERKCDLLHGGEWELV